jgi:hydrogenase maturation factor HypF (carbamoyltransferase family)
MDGPGSNPAPQAMREQPSEAVQSRGVQVRGVVQGVGFRLFVYRLATEERLAGSIGNDTDGVSIELEGPSARIEAFLVAYGFAQAAVRARDAIGISKVALAGGCLHKRRLARLMRIGLQEESLQVFKPCKVSSVDGGNYGQAVVAAAILRGRNPGLVSTRGGS